MGSGFLAIWSDIEAAAETDYLHWMTREHARERVSIPGFLAMRFFRALHTDARRYMMLYELASPDVVGGADYLARLNNPTPWTQRIMPQLGNFVRGGGRVVAASGTGQGGFVAALPLSDMATVDGPGLNRRHDKVGPHFIRLCVGDRSGSNLREDPRKEHADR